MKIAIILPTRGLVFTKVEMAIEKMREEYDIVVFRSWNKNIPDAQNALVKQALQTDLGGIGILLSLKYLTFTFFVNFISINGYLNFIYLNFLQILIFFSS